MGVVGSAVFSFIGVALLYSITLCSFLFKSSSGLTGKKYNMLVYCKKSL
jgi:hypothetical protein